ncbi:hypothetical protein Pmani_010971 [Petrolisthes manimaculis]|uniref:Gustatory receptor n=1 Tax=Petrolisthes manimaculis TaxID=1843537 RepID=A0AAE1UGR4_9EUCA|nr:hypothetical protein Pmani_010971 [Petrolisthes manimaculis]
MKGTNLLRVAIFILQIIGGFPFKRVTEKPINVKVRGKEAWGEDGRGGRRTRKDTPNNKNNSNKMDMVCVNDKANSNNSGTLKQQAKKSSLNNKNNNNSITTSITTVATTKYYQPSTWWKLWSYLVSLSLLCFITLVIYELTFAKLNDESSTTFLAVILSDQEIFENVLYYFTASFTLMMFFTTVYLEKLFYRSVKLSLAKHFYRNFTSRVLPDLTDNGVSIYEALSLTTHWISEEKISPIERVEEGICDNVTEVFQDRKGVNEGGIYDLVHSDNNSEIQQDKQLLKGTREMLLRIHALHRLCLQYLALPVLLLTFSSVCQSIVSVYFISIYFSNGSDLRQVQLFFFTVLYCLPLLLFLNIPVMLQTEVDDVRVLLQILLHRHQHDSQTKAELREVLEVVGEWPGFNICRVFTLDRARLVDVSSFVVTYLIILLQFRITEMN